MCEERPQAEQDRVAAICARRHRAHVSARIGVGSRDQPIDQFGGQSRVGNQPIQDVIHR
ncbi:hypothetical protein [Kitasatospora sp. NPDC090091]|uniref:hypothetical protein n=1 Tax=Kitasatospora sp. NPDC090091 TaxID=3364081 RepID=UPI003802E3F4